MQRILSCLLYLLLLASLAPVAGAADLFQWIDASGTIHFTDDPRAIPLFIQRSGKLLMRKNFFPAEESSAKSGAAAAPVAPKLDSEIANQSTFDSNSADATPATDRPPQEIDTVIVESPRLRRTSPACPTGRTCKAQLFRPDFNNRQYLHPDVFNGGSRQYIQP